MSARRIIRTLARLLLGVMLFTQGALALGACEWGHRDPARAVAGMDEMACCVDEDGFGSSPGDANLCLAHCTSDAQRVDAYDPVVPFVLPVGFVVVLRMPQDDLTVASRMRATAGGFASPPRIILFQNLRI
jgi:hypothetical protein